MEYTIMFAVCFVGGFFGAFLGGRFHKSTPVPVETPSVERLIRKTFGLPEPEKLNNVNAVVSWLYPPVGEVE
jgi:hypothetical protein